MFRHIFQETARIVKFLDVVNLAYPRTLPPAHGAGSAKYAFY